MGIFDGGFDAANAADAPANDFTPFPAGEYALRILEVQETQSKAGNDMLKVALEVADGPHENRRLWDYVVPSNNIGIARLKNLCLACGLANVMSGSELEGHIVQAKVKIEPASNGYSESNKVVDYLPKQQSAPATAPVPPRAGNSEW